MEPVELIAKAKEAQKLAYAPYSNYHVGAAILTKSGKVFTGCNVENSSYGLTNCAERTAVFKAVSEGETEFEAIAVVGPNKGISCCGACRQVMWEFAEDLVIYGEMPDGSVGSKTIGEMLPGAFSKSALME